MQWHADIEQVRRLNYTPPAGPCKQAAKEMTLADKEKFIRNLHDHLEETYLKYCDTAGPLFWVAATVSRLIMSKMSLVIYGFRDPNVVDQLPQSVKDHLFVSAIEIMEYSRLLETETSTKKWGWLFHTYVQWHAIAYILREVCVRPRSDIVERGWRSVDAVFTSWSEALRKHQTNSQLWTPMRKLMIKARRKRQADMDAMNKKGIQTPRTEYPKSVEEAAMNGLGSTGVDNTNVSAFSPTVDSRIWNTGLAYQPAIGDIDLFADETPSRQTQLNQEYLQTYMPSDQLSTEAFFLEHNSALMGMDLDMPPLEGGENIDDINWAGWDDAIKDFSLQSDQQGDQRGPNINGFGNWW